MVKTQKNQKIIPPDLEALYGHKYKITLEEAYYAERPEFRQQEKVWHMLIPCKYGTIGPWGTDTLVASTFGPGAIANRLKRLSGVTVWQDGDDGVSVVFLVPMFQTIAKIIRPRSKRRLSESERTKATRNLV